MNSSGNSTETRRAVFRRQLAAFGALLLLFSLVTAILYGLDRRREWVLRQEQAQHRLELSFELVDREMERVFSDVLFIASQQPVREFTADRPQVRAAVVDSFCNFLKLKRKYQQIRLIDRSGQETLRVDLRDEQINVVPTEQLQDKKDRYYVKEAFDREADQVFVSDFDLNQEMGAIERPLVPVIRFATPIPDASGEIRQLLVLNYRGSLLLHELASIAMPGNTWLIRGDGNFLLGPHPHVEWGWLLGHAKTFPAQFPNAWKAREPFGECQLTPAGAFAFRPLARHAAGSRTGEGAVPEKQLLIVSFLPAEKVFETSKQLLSRLLVFLGMILLPLWIMTRFWAVASARRQEQNRRIAESEEQLRELSSRLLRIQEEERRSISREIHDQLGQQATAIHLDLKLAERNARSDQVRQQLQRAIDETEQLLDTLRNFAARVRPAELDDLGLYDAVESHLWDFQKRTSIDTRLDSNIKDVCLPDEIAENVYRLIQEALNNVLKHANATIVNVTIRKQPVEDRYVLDLTVEDNGVGVERREVHVGDEGHNREPVSGLGILGMRERVDLLGGNLHIDSVAQQGTRIDVRLPLPLELKSQETTH